ncbi:MAG TPA: SCO family protein [Fredinandcohnia sp.]|nr:SCO family protein [Fredinandcohnia sp.]
MTVFGPARRAKWAIALALLLPAQAFGQYGLAPLGGSSNETPRQLREVGVDERLGEKLPLDVRLTDHEGKTVTLGDYFGKGRPVLINLVYYECPMLCGLVLNGITKGMKELNYLPGREFDIVTVSIDPKEDTELAAAKRKTMLEELGREGAEAGWYFHTAEEGEIARLADALGFRYRWDEASKQWAHPAVIFFASEEGKITRYLYGIEYKPFELRLAVTEAGEGKVGTTLDRILLFCFHYDGDSQAYRIAAKARAIGGAIIVLGVFGFLAVMWRRSSRIQKD